MGKPILIEQSVGTTPSRKKYRIRKETFPNGQVVWTQTIKTNQSHQSRAKTKIETTTSISAEQAVQLWNPQTIVRKLRYKVNGYEIDVFLTPANPDELVVVEREFATLPQADAFNPPPWLTQEITHTKGFSNQSLARSGWPK